MTLEELDRELLSDEERLVSSLQEREAAKEALKASRVALRKARITSISNKLLAPYRRFRIEKAIAKYDAMIERIEKEQEKQRVKEEKLRQKEAKKEAKADFKAAIRDKRKEDIVNFVNDRKDDVINFANDKKSDVIDFSKGIASEVSDTFDYIREMGSSRVSSASSFISNVKTSLIATLDKKTTLHRDIGSKILDYKEKKVDRDYEKSLENAKSRQIQEEINNSIRREANRSDDITIKEKYSRITKEKNYMGKATNRVIEYFRTKKNKLDDIVFDSKVNMAYMGYKASSVKNKIMTVFNNQISSLKNKADNFIGNTMVAASDTYNNIKEGINDKICDISSSIEHRNEIKQRKEDMINAINEEEKRRNKIREEQLKMRRQTIENINNGDIFEGATPVIEGGMRR